MYWSWLRARADVGVKLKSFNVFQSGKALMRVWQKYSMWPQFNKFASACVEFADPRMINDHILINLHALGLATHNLLDSPSARQLTMQAVKFLALFSDRQCVSAMLHSVCNFKFRASHSCSQTHNCNANPYRYAFCIAWSCGFCSFIYVPMCCTCAVFDMMHAL